MSKIRFTLLSEEGLFTLGDEVLRCCIEKKSEAIYSRQMIEVKVHPVSLRFCYFVEGFFHKV